MVRVYSSLANTSLINANPRISMSTPLPTSQCFHSHPVLGKQ